MIRTNKNIATGNVEPRYEVLSNRKSQESSRKTKEAGQMVKEGEIIARIKVIPEMVQLNSAESRVNVANIS
jgi:HlyD family secretion protein